jgi:hypothetical protein
MDSYDDFWLPVRTPIKQKIHVMNVLFRVELKIYFMSSSSVKNLFGCNSGNFEISRDGIAFPFNSGSFQYEYSQYHPIMTDYLVTK